jgi:ELWxxDGT repeat protein
MRHPKRSDESKARAARLDRVTPLFRLAVIVCLTWSVAAGAPPAWGESAGVRRVEGLETPEFPTNGMPETLLPAGDRFVYVARSGGGPAPSRLLLWASDGSAAGTEAVRELCVGCWLTASASTGAVVFLAVCESGSCDSERGESRLWRSDGSRSGTYPLTLPFRAFVPALVVAGDFAYLLACGSQCSVMTSDGTVSGTRPLVLPEPVAWTTSLTAWKDEVYLLSEDPSSSDATLWRLSARRGEAERVRDLSGLPCLAAVPSIDRLLLVQGSDLWVSDGTSAGTTLLRHFQEIDFNFEDRCMIADRGGRAWFVASGKGTGEQLWSTDGTAAGTWRATNFGRRHPFGYDPDLLRPALDGGQLASVGSRLLFPALYQGVLRLWTTTGNWRRTRLLDGCPGGCPEVVEGERGPWGGRGAARPFAPLRERVAFIGRRPGEPVAMWITDGTGRGTVKVQDLPLREYDEPPWVTTRGDRWYLSTPAEPEGEYGPPRNTLWASDGTPRGTVALATTEPVDDEASRFESMLLGLAGRVYFPGCAGDDCGLLATDGRTAGAVRTVTFEAGSVLAGWHPLIARVGSHVLLAGEDSFWLADATAVVELPESATGHFDTYDGWSVAATASGDRTFVRSSFLAGTVWFGDSFWSSDGTVAGTTLLEGPYSATVSRTAPWRDGSVLFASERYLSTDGPSRTVASLGTSDGTVAGTVRFVDLPANLYPGALITHGAVALFVLSPTSSLERDPRLWISDGTAAGTRALTSAFATLSGPVVLGERAYALASRVSGEPILLVIDLGSRAVSEVALAPLGIARVAAPTTAAGRLWLAARAADEAEWSLWVSDGTPAGTQRLPATAESPLTALDDVVYFSATDAVHGRELWRSDGTVAGTALVADLAPGLASGAPQSNLVAWDGRLYFAAADGVHGQELWSSDGTAAGTRLEIDLAAGAAGSSPTDLTLADDRLFFAADDGVSGWQLWVMD